MAFRSISDVNLRSTADTRVWRKLRRVPLEHFTVTGCWLDATTTTSLAFWLALVVLGEAMSRSGVQKLVLECNTLPRLCMKLVFQNSIRNGNLRELIVERGGVTTAPKEEMDQFCHALIGNTKLKRLSFVDCGIADDVLPSLEQLLGDNRCAIEELDLSENTIANGAVFGRVLAHNNAALKSLRLRGNCMVGFEAEFLLNGLTKNTSLTHLDLSDNDIHECYAKAKTFFAQNTTLVELNVSGTYCDRFSLRQLCRGLGESGQIRRLELANNTFADGGFAVLTNCVESLSALQTLNVSGTREEDVRESKHDIPIRFRTGNQCHNSEEFNAFTLALAQHPALTSVNVSGMCNEDNSMNAKAFAMLLSSSSHIRNLNLSNNNFGQNVEEAFAELMQNLSSNTVVQVLNLSHCHLSDDHVSSLTKSLESSPKTSALHTLCIAVNDIGPTGATAFSRVLRKLNCLKELRIDGNPIQNAGVLSIVKGGRKALETLDISFCGMEKGIESQLAELLGSCSALATFKTGCRNDNRSPPHMLSLLRGAIMMESKIRTLEIHGAIPHQDGHLVLHRICSLPSLRSLTVEFDGCNDALAKQINSMLYGIHSVSELNIRFPNDQLPPQLAQRIFTKGGHPLAPKTTVAATRTSSSTFTSMPSVSPRAHGNSFHRTLSSGTLRALSAHRSTESSSLAE